MKQQLIYKGVLDEDTFAHIISTHNRGNNYFVEVKPDWFSFSVGSSQQVEEWKRFNLKMYASVTEDCQGQPITHLSQDYTVITPNNDISNGAFIAFRSKQEHQAFCKAFPDLIANPCPFMTTWAAW